METPRFSCFRFFYLGDNPSLFLSPCRRPPCGCPSLSTTQGEQQSSESTRLAHHCCRSPATSVSHTINLPNPSTARYQCQVPTEINPAQCRTTEWLIIPSIRSWLAQSRRQNMHEERTSAILFPIQSSQLKGSNAMKNTPQSKKG